MRMILVLAGLVLALPAYGLSQPDGTPIPDQQSGNNLWDLFGSLNEPISPQVDAADVPETYAPSCHLNFTLLSRGHAGFHNAFGWYYVTADGGAPTDPKQLHVLLDCNTQPPTAVPFALDGGGELISQIGFFLLTPQQGTTGTNCIGGDCCATTTHYGYIYYSQKAFNPDNGLQSGGKSYIHLLTYDSKKEPATFYFAWEDLFNGGDNEFMDLVAKVNGIRCTGAGGTCTVPGKQGMCALGTYQCVDGQLTCVQQFQPQPESCDGIDSNCDGVVDNPPDGGSLCPTGETCQNGSCTGPCGELSGCLPYQTCQNGTCVDPACEGKTCPSGQVCQNGNCIDPCSGVTCPRGQYCAAGRCVNPCSVVSCGSGELCYDGACRDSCQCAGCAAGFKCASDGRCLPTACVGTSCPSGTYCVDDGGCLDSCFGVKCPGSEVCQMGQCIASGGSSASGGSGGTTGALTTSGTSGGSGTGTTGTGSAGTSAGSGATGGTSGSAGEKVAGCSCTSLGDDLALLALPLLLGLRRRRFGSPRA